MDRVHGRIRRQTQGSYAEIEPTSLQRIYFLRDKCFREPRIAFENNRYAGVHRVCVLKGESAGNISYPTWIHPVYLVPGRTRADAQGRNARQTE